MCLKSLFKAKGGHVNYAVHDAKNYTVRYAHLAERPPLEVGQKIRRGQLIGIMGNTGDSTAPHLHIDCVEGLQTGRYSLAMIEAGMPKSSPRQLNFFIDSELFGIRPEITTYYADPDYQKTLLKVHHGYDVVPINRHLSRSNFGIHWNRSFEGEAVAIYEDTAGYGICLYVAYQA
jgi:hypothetical protein